jgi:hypothetical protein
MSSRRSKGQYGGTATTPGGEMALGLFVDIAVTGYAAALPWYERFSGGRPPFLPNDTEPVWKVAEYRYTSI